MKFIPNFLLDVLLVTFTVLLFRWCAPHLSMSWQDMLLIAVTVLVMTIIDRLIWLKVMVTAIGDRITQHEKLRNTVIRLSDQPRDPVTPSTHIRKGLL